VNEKERCCFLSVDDYNLRAEAIEERKLE